jgi:signal peptidase II
VNVVVLAVVILIADRVTKEVVLRNHDVGHRGRGIVRLVFTERPLLTRGTSLRTEFMLWCAAVACAVSAVLCAPALQHNLFATAGVAVALSGSLGNLADRLMHGAVVDFVAIGRWPVFNLADVAIVGGVAIAGASLV